MEDNIRKSNVNPPKCEAEDYIQWLLASPKEITCTQAALASLSLVAHDAYTRLLERIEPDSSTLWDEVRDSVQLTSGYLIVDDTTIDKPYGSKIELVTRHWSGKHRRVVDGINLISLLWTDGDIAIPIDWRIFHKPTDALTMEQPKHSYPIRDSIFPVSSQFHWSIKGRTKENNLQLDRSVKTMSLGFSPKLICRPSSTKNR